MESIKSIAEFIDIAGGEASLAASLHRHQASITRWRSKGIPIDCWSKLISMYDITPDELFAINENIWKNRKKSGARTKER
jgi:hypothetical protein